MRIVAGRWRGRQIGAPRDDRVRPTGDRVREAWMSIVNPWLPGAKAVDLFAGSGALGLEALSRGAAHVTFVERDGQAARELRARLAEWGARDARVERGDALAFLARSARPFDIAFLDPPFAAGLLGEAAALLEENGWLSDAAFIYVECGARAGVPQLPARWLPLRTKSAGEVGYHLYARG
jgi:16S rRNA (guanine966-N2)-methyltransferase